MKSMIAAAVGVVLITAVGTPQQLPSALDTLVATEIAFAKTATEKGIRDSFLEYFAEDAIAFNPTPVSAIARLRSRPARPFAEYELRWEPREGDVAVSGELGWLTGPSTFIDHTSPNPSPEHGNYLSVWRRSGDGAWRVLIDIGSSPPHAVSFKPGFTRFPLPSRYAGGDHAASRSALRVADEKLNTGISAVGSAAAYRQVTIESSRLHRSGFPPQIGTAAIATWMAANARGMTTRNGAAECAQSGDLGYSYGTFVLDSSAPAHGAYVRVWQREATGRWILVVDVVQPS